MSQTVGTWRYRSGKILSYFQVCGRQVFLELFTHYRHRFQIKNYHCQQEKSQIADMGYCWTGTLP